MTAVSSLPATPAAAPGRRRADAEAARYGVLRRLAPALKHDMVVNLQAVAMMAEVLNARLEKGTPAGGDLQKQVSKINRLAREAVLNCLQVAAWIEPSEDEGIRLREGVDECVALLRSNFNFRGFSVDNQVPDSGFEVSRVKLRNLLAAVLISLTDEAHSPGELLVQAQVGGGWASLSIVFVPRQEEDAALPPFEPNYRALDWADVQALAAAESVELSREEGPVALRLPRMTATPLQIVPL
ncbi:hypothetical protein [Ramlibacter tataouinensis]|uniref:Uncharacterized protein n=1 Tax=Ramlibacter tataouinensis (strain ATCC BAA-407 / DSM 14655 / LMG 21543 / TTB310) TaxID=365046 RepID=F5XYP6_RAMTT|nr:hypothetical protein [Ramlibacter tataouinensis]AEG94413.1 Hypothetical protein Rta_33015 [Ramlibacter tataouinensis TTB310]